MRAIAAAVPIIGLGGCTASNSGTQANSEAAPATAPATPREVHFTARDFAFEGPDSIPSGMTTIVLHNGGPNLHHLLLIRLDEGKTVDDLKAASRRMKPTDMPPAWAVPAGGVNPPMPGSDTRATFMVEPGNYAVICEVDIPDHVAHAMKGMIKALTVTASSTASAEAPASDMTINLVNFGFAPSAKFTAGHHVIKVVNNGTQPHELELIQLAPGKTMDDLAKWGQTYAGTLPGTSLAGVAPMTPGQVEYVPFDLTAGNYAMLCFVTDPTNHKPHMAEGMALPFTIE